MNVASDGEQVAFFLAINGVREDVEKELEAAVRAVDCLARAVLGRPLSRSRELSRRGHGLHAATGRTWTLEGRRAVRSKIDGPMTMS